MGQRLGNTEFVQFIDDLTRLHFELPRQLIDSDLTHCPGRFTLTSDAAKYRIRCAANRSFQRQGNAALRLFRFR
jgi:hypothetical protein